MAKTTKTTGADTAAKAKAKAAVVKKAAKAAPKEPKAAAAKAAKPAAATVKISDKPWLKSYPKDVPDVIGPLADASLGDLMASSCKQYAGRPAFSCMGKTLTFAELERQSAAFGAYLQSKGLKEGARVAMMMPNVLQYPVAMMAALRAGYTVVNVNPLYTPRELEHQLKDSGAEAIVILENFADDAAGGDRQDQRQAGRRRGDGRHARHQGHARQLRGAARQEDGAGLVAARPCQIQRRAEDRRRQDLQAGQGRRRRRRLPAIYRRHHRHLQGRRCCCTAMCSPMSRRMRCGWRTPIRSKPKPADLTYICALPLYHIFALTVNALMGMQQGAHNILIPNPRDIPGFVKELGKYPIHIFPGLNTLFNALLNNEDFRKLDFKPLILTLGGGMAVQRVVAERWKELTGCGITEGYGLSETSPVATANKFSAGEFTGTIGLPLPSTEIAIRDDDGKDLPIGEVGEICIRGPQVMAGYWNRPDETAKVMTKDGFFNSGDMGFMDEKRLHQDRRPQEGHDPGLRLQRLSRTSSKRSWRGIPACSKWRRSACRTSIRARCRNCSSSRRTRS